VNHLSPFSTRSLHLRAESQSKLGEDRLGRGNVPIVSHLLTLNILDQARQGKKAQAWGSVIRTYGKTVKDLRTGVESGNPKKIMKGDLDKFIEAFLRLKAGLSPTPGKP
jgi:hypothetical protein